MSEFFDLDEGDRTEVLEIAAQASGRPFYILEKDIWVVKVLSVLFPYVGGDGHMTFKGGTSLSKGYGLIRRFSEDIDLTVEIRQLIPELADGSADPVPGSNSEASRWRKAVDAELPGWIERHLLGALDQIHGMSVIQAGAVVTLTYPPLAEAASYVAPTVVLEFGARGTGEPSEDRDIVCDTAQFVSGVNFPVAKVRTMRPERTFWEKATAIHAILASGKAQGDRLSRHWYDLVLLARQGVADAAFSRPDVAQAVSAHKARFFRVRRKDGEYVDYQAAINGGLTLVPEGDALDALRSDYEEMVNSGLIEDDPAPSFDELLAECAAIAEQGKAGAA